MADTTVSTTSGNTGPATHASEPKKAIDPRKVLACGTCRKRKLKCDSKRPKCSTCARLGHICEYDEVRKKSGPKRGYVKELEARLKQVENLLTAQGGTNSPPQDVPAEQHSRRPSSTPQQPLPSTDYGGIKAFNNGTSFVQSDTNMSDSNYNGQPEYSLSGFDDFNWDMISLGLEEPLPAQDVMDELYQVYFEKVHPSLPMIHRPRFLSSLNMPTNQRPPVCLRYAMWANACQLVPRYKTSAEQFYYKARKYLEQDEMKGHGESFISVPHAQAWILVTTFEFKSMYFPRAWASTGRATRLSQMMGLHRQDRLGLDVKQTMAPPKDWIEREERRRVFWMAYCNDRYASIGTGWPMSIDENDILTNLPASEEAFLTGKADPTPSLPEVLKGEGTSGLSAFAAVCMLATLFGRNLTHLHRPGDEDNDHDLNGDFWKRHRGIDNILLNTSLSLPAHLRLPYGLSEPNTVFSNLMVHTSTICLHQAAIFKADKHRLPSPISTESKRRCIVAADQITNIMKMCSHQDLSLLNPFIAFCLYVAARVFVQYLKSKKEDQTVRASLTFLLAAMVALRSKNPLTESFLVQLDVDLDGSGLNIPSPLGAQKYVNRPSGEYPVNSDAVKCSPLFEIRETQTLGQAARGFENSTLSESAQDVDFVGLGPNFVSHHRRPINTIWPHSPSGTPSAMSSTVQPISSGSPGWDKPYSPQMQKSPAEHSNSSHSNQPTPGSSNNNSGSSHSSGFTPRVEDYENMQPFFGNPKPQTDGIVTGTFVPGLLLPTSHVQTNNERSASHGQPTEFNDAYHGTGFTPGPSGTGFTPGQSYGDIPTGLTPGPTGMTPLNWNDMHMTENGEWSYENPNP